MLLLGLGNIAAYNINLLALSRYALILRPIIISSIPENSENFGIFGQMVSRYCETPMGHGLAF